MPNVTEDTRLMGLYEDLRLRLLDLSKRNQLLNYGLSARSKRFLQIVDGTLERAHILLAGDEATLRIAPLPEPDDVPSEERTDEFRSALDRGRATDVEYLTAVEAIEATGRDGEVAMEKLERGLRDRVRAELGLPPRPSRKELNRVFQIAKCAVFYFGIDPSLDLEPASQGKDNQVLQSLKFPDELEVVVEKISADARLAEQEMGLSTLFLAFGFLEWYDSDTSDKGAFAPLLLLPVQIDRQKSRGKPIYSLSVREGGWRGGQPQPSGSSWRRTSGASCPTSQLDDEDTPGSDRGLHQAGQGGADRRLKAPSASPTLASARSFLIRPFRDVFGSRAAEVGRPGRPRLGSDILDLTRIGAENRLRPAPVTRCPWTTIPSTSPRSRGSPPS